MPPSSPSILPSIIQERGYMMESDRLSARKSTLKDHISNPDALGFDESEKGIFGSLKNITQLPPGSPKEGDRVVDSTSGAAKDLVTEEASKESPTAGTDK
ncbi:uncharacterized protein LOC120644224 isoform X2 [Panicum virgatum]|uniref:uncharacterized protein LOC120644224 isoform X2 n=1 Tax=Panicum virgatum TaxID=38727 RepID=UPI0019D5C172|nr:uncharacterized protein LOC120644224 isoform X2 [Panicum virgatum]